MYYRIIAIHIPDTGDIRDIHIILHYYHQGVKHIICK